jgi:sialate O-acetylesterase
VVSQSVEQASSLAPDISVELRYAAEVHSQLEEAERMRFMSVRHAAVFSCLVVLSQAPAFAVVKPHVLISEGMVLQRGMDVPIWGTAAENEKVTVRFQGQEATTATRDRKWLVRLHDLRPGGPFEMVIAGENTIKLNDVYVGEVWVCSGQSNMVWSVRMSHVPQEVIDQSANPQIRFFTVPLNSAYTPQTEIVPNPRGDQELLTSRIPYTPDWKECRPDVIVDISAVGYFFARNLQKALGVPVGLLHCPVGGTWVEAWVSDRAIQADPELKTLAARFWENYSKSVDQYLHELDEHREAVTKALRERKDLPRAPVHPDPPPFHLPLSRNVSNPSIFYNGMITPLMPYGIRGAIWYQGESNHNRPALYKELFSAMIESWRDGWGAGDFPFVFVQIPPYARNVPEQGFAEVRQAQLRASLEVPRTAMVTTTDVGDEKDIHPPHKDIVGGRLALAARALVYGEQIEYSGPIFDRMELKDDRAILSFTHLGGGLVARDGPLRGFAVAGPDHKFMDAEAEIRGDRVIVWSRDVREPKAVRFGWADYPVVNLWNKAGLPASPFTTQ